MFLFSLCDPQKQKVSEKGLLGFFPADTAEVDSQLGLWNLSYLWFGFFPLSLLLSPPSGCLELVKMLSRLEPCVFQQRP